jgi:hypothetical protein
MGAYPPPSATQDGYMPHSACPDNHPTNDRLYFTDMPPWHNQGGLDLKGSGVFLRRSMQRSTGSASDISPAAPLGLGIYPMTIEKYPYGRIDQPVITSRNDIKRRTKTGCITCRRRRIKCDEKHPTCLNCDRSKRVCLGYDPLFQICTDKRRRKNNSWAGGVSKISCLPSPKSCKEEIVGDPVIGGSSGASLSEGNSPKSGQFAPLSCGSTPRTSNGRSPRDDSKSNRMRIASLLDAAAVLDSKEVARFPTNPNDKPGGIAWGDLCQYYKDNVAPFLDNLFCTTRFSEISAVCRKQLSQSLKFRNGEELAILEAIRQILSILCPSLYLEGLAVDEANVPKLEELRITSNYKLLRCIVQLIGFSKNTEFLPVDRPDEPILTKVRVLHQFVHFGDDGKPACQIQPPDDFANIFRNGSDPEQVWKLLEYISQDGRLSDGHIETLAGSCQGEGEIHGLKVAVLLGLYYNVSRSPLSSKQSKLRIRLMDHSGADGINALLRRLLDMSLCL